MGNRLGQISAELMVTVSAMVLLLLVMYLVNQSLQQTWDGEKQVLEASSAANQVAIAINRAVAGGDGTQVRLNNFVGGSIANVTISPPRAVTAFTWNGYSSSTPIVTNNTNITGNITINQEIVVGNTGGTITIAAS